MKVLNKIRVPPLGLRIDSISMQTHLSTQVELGKSVEPIFPITLGKTYDVIGVIWQGNYSHYVLKSDLAAQSDCTTWLAMARTNLFELEDKSVPGDWCLALNGAIDYPIWTLSPAALNPITKLYDQLQTINADAQELARQYVFK